VHDFVYQNAVKLTEKHLACQIISRPSSRTPRRTEKRGEGKGEGRGWRGEELVSTAFQTKVTPLQASIRQIIGQQLEVLQYYH
jgi:hypothetical protein